MIDARRDRAAAETLDRYWDAVLDYSVASPPGDLDPDLAETVRKARDLDTTPAPHPTFASTLWEDLMAPTAISPRPFTGPPLPSVLDESVSTRPFPTFPRPLFLARLAAAVLLFVMLAGAVLAVLYPHRPRGDGLLRIFAPIEAPTAVDPISGSVLLDLTLTDFPPMRTFGGIEVTEYPSGAYSLERTPDYPEVFYIAVGPMTVVVEETPMPVQIFAPGARATTSQISAGDEAVLDAGTAVVAPSGSILSLHNDGTAPARQISLVYGVGAYGSLRDGATSRWGSVGMPQDIFPPVSVILTRLWVNPSAALPIPETGWGNYAAATVDAERGRELSFSADAGWRNTGIEPMEVYLLKLTSGALAEDGVPNLDTP